MKKMLFALALLPLVASAETTSHQYQSDNWLLDELEACRAQYLELSKLGNVWADTYTVSADHNTETWQLKAHLRNGWGGPAIEAGRLTIVKTYDLTLPVPADGSPYSKTECKLEKGRGTIDPVKGEVQKFDVYVNYLLGALEECRPQYSAFRHRGYVVSPKSYTYDGAQHTESYVLRAWIPGSPVSGAPAREAGELKITRIYDYSRPIPADGGAPYRTVCETAQP